MLMAARGPDVLLRIRDALARSVGEDGVAGEDLLCALEEILTVLGQPVCPTQTRLGAVLDRLPYRPQRCRTFVAAPVSADDAARLLFQLRRATPPVIAVAMQRRGLAAHDKIARLRVLHDAVPCTVTMLGHLRRFALALLELVEDDW
ncbi:hypothetical protein ACFVQ4_15020 [Streptomyces laurentii]|uniref:hypothetical protein n=1 Tax=Streptomyces laurentii TaxID=39478 RepID=UPI00367C32A7